MFFFLVVSGCASKMEATKPDDDLPGDASEMEENDYIQAAAINRGLYVTQDGVITYLDDFKCNGFEMQMHRGHPERPENSKAAVIAAIEADAPVVEIDTTLVEDGYGDDGYWVVHHDSRTGRAVTHATKDSQKLTKIDGEDWGRYRHRDPETGNLTSQRPHFLSEIVEFFAKKAEDDQTLHIEIKHDWDKDQVQQIDALVKHHLGNDQIRYSSFSLEALKIIRELSPNVYLGLIQKPHRYSVKQLRRDVDRAGAGDKDYDRYGHWLDRSMRYYSRDNLMRMSQVRYIEKVLGQSSGLHIDVRDAVLSASTMARIQQSGMTVATYSINGQDYHESRLKMAMNRGFKPDSLIMDETPYGFCGQFYQPEKVGTLPPSAPKRAHILDALPLDADLRREDVFYMARDGLYVTLAGDVKTLQDSGDKASGESTSQASQSGGQYAPNPDLSVGKRDPEQEFSLENPDGPLVIDKETLE